MKQAPRSSPAAVIHLSRYFPAAPTNGLPGPVLLLAGSFSHEEHGRARRPFARHRGLSSHGKVAAGADGDLGGNGVEKLHGIRLLLRLTRLRGEQARS